MSIYKDAEQWRLDLINNPPRVANQFSQEEWEDMVLNEFIKNPNIFYGEKNGNYGNPTNYSHDEETRSRISKNHAKHWLGKDVPWKGISRPDSVEIARKMGLSRIGTDPWNKGQKIGSHSDEHKQKISNANKGKPKPKLECPHCGKTGGAPQMKQWHFDNCKAK